MKTVTCVAPVNIAVIKYWGKKCEELIIPLNDSLSATLSMDQMCAKTTVMASPDFKENKIWLNGKEESFENKRLLNCLEEIKKRVQTEGSCPKEMMSWKIHICSENNFPTAAGLASSAAGYACLVYALSQLYSVKSEISSIARRGSGSACRSVFGGWVRWHTGNKVDGSDSIAKQIVSEDYWPEMRVLIIVVSDNKKKVSSKIGMKNSVDTSELIKYRAEYSVPKRIDKIIEAIKSRDFNTFGRLTIEDSNQFHAVCLDTYPPCVYMNDVSHNIADFVHKFNDYFGSVKVAYTYDAGPNACLYLLKDTVKVFVNTLNKYFPPNNNTVEYVKGIPIDLEASTKDAAISLPLDVQRNDSFKYIIHTKVGSSPKLITDINENLLTENGLPK